MTVGYHAPLPPVRTGVADYAARLLAELRKLGSINVSSANASVHLYHLGNNQLHRAIYERAIEKPGVVVLHDSVLQHFYLGALDESKYVDEFVYNYGEWERALAHRLYTERANSATDSRYFARPLLRRVAERSLAIIVHNPSAAAMVRAHAPEAKVFEIPHFFEAREAPDPAGVARLRQAWDAGSADCVFALMGYLRESKRVIPVLDAFRRVHARHPNTRLVVAGDFVSSDLKRAVQPYFVQAGIVRLPHLSDRAFWDVATAVDCCLNLRYPAAGETSGIAIRLMGIAKAVFVTDGEEVARFPQSAVVRVSPGIHESAELVALMSLAAQRPDLMRAIGQRASAHIRERHRIALVASEYWRVLCSARDISR